MRLHHFLPAACCLLLAVSGVAQTMTPPSGKMSGMEMPPAQSGTGAKPMASPPATTQVSFGGQEVSVKYHTPSMRGRVIMGGLVPYGEVWRTGANDATTLITPVPLHIGALLVPAGTYTLYTLPSAGTWQLIVNKETGQWGTVYHEAMDLGRVAMKHKTLDTPQEVMSISFEQVGKDSAELHVRWEKTDEWVKVTTP